MRPTRSPLRGSPTTRRSASAAFAPTAIRPPPFDSAKDAPQTDALRPDVEDRARTRRRPPGVSHRFLAPRPVHAPVPHQAGRRVHLDPAGPRYGADQTLPGR